MRGSKWKYLITHSPKVRENGKYYMFSMGTLLWRRAHCKLLFRDWGKIPAGFFQSGFQQGMFFPQVSQHRKPMTRWCELWKRRELCAFGISNLDIINDWWKWSTIRKLHFWASAIVCKEGEVQVWCDGVCRDPDHPTNQTYNKILAKIKNYHFLH